MLCYARGRSPARTARGLGSTAQYYAHSGAFAVLTRFAPCCLVLSSGYSISAASAAAMKEVAELESVIAGTTVSVTATGSDAVAASAAAADENSAHDSSHYVRCL